MLCKQRNSFSLYTDKKQKYKFLKHYVKRKTPVNSRVQAVVSSLRRYHHVCIWLLHISIWLFVYMVKDMVKKCTATVISMEKKPWLRLEKTTNSQRSFHPLIQVHQHDKSK